MACAAGPALAQGGGGKAAGGRHNRDDVYKMIDAYILSNVQESLDLTDDQYVKILPLVKRLQNDRREYGRRRIEAMRELRRLMESGAATEPRVGELLKEVKAVEAEEPAAVRKDRDAIDAILNPVQQAKYRLLEIEVERRIRDVMQRLRQQRPGARPADPAPE
jgi:Spy/CpxP family protein refolding chaperone